jgi:hypothetical protein
VSGLNYGFDIHVYCCCERCRTCKDENGKYVPRLDAQVCEPTASLSWKELKANGWRISRKYSLAWAPGHVRRKTDKSPFA